MTQPRDPKQTEISESGTEAADVSGSVEQTGGQGRRAYQSPRMSTGDIFERIVVMSEAGPNVEECPQ